MVYAIVRSGGTQQKVAVGDVVQIDKVTDKVGDTVSLPAVLLVDGDAVTHDAKADDSSGVEAAAPAKKAPRKRGSASKPAGPPPSVEPPSTQADSTTSEPSGQAGDAPVLTSEGQAP